MSESSGRVAKQTREEEEFKMSVLAVNAKGRQAQPSHCCPDAGLRSSIEMTRDEPVMSSSYW